MYRIDVTTAAGALPIPDAAGTGGYFAHAPPGSGATPTVVTSDWCNGIQEELMAFLTYAAIAADKTNHGQVLAAVLSLLDTAGVNGAGSIFGMITSNTPGSPTSSISISAGQCRDSTNAKSMVLAAPLSKSLTATWAAGNGNGGRSTAWAALANGQSGWLFMIFNPTTLAVDALFDQSPTAPTLPIGFTFFRCIGAVVLDAAATTIRLFDQAGDWFYYKLRSTDYAATANGAGVSYYRQLAVPVGLPLMVKTYFQSSGTITAASAILSGVFSPAFGAPPAYGSPTQWAWVRRLGTADSAGGTFSYGTSVQDVQCDAAGKVYTFSNDNSDVIALGVLGFKFERGKFY
jgi:hypothetical protein